MSNIDNDIIEYLDDYISKDVDIRSSLKANFQNEYKPEHIDKVMDNILVTIYFDGETRREIEL